MKIYFDGSLFPSDNVLSLSQTAKLYDEKFWLGATLCRQIKIEVDANYLASIPNECVITDDYDALLFTLRLESYTEVNQKYIAMVFTDKMALGNKNFDYSALVPCTIQDIIELACDTIGVSYPTGTYYGMDRMIYEYDNRRTVRNYISYVAELNGGFARISNDNRLEFVRFQNKGKKISLEQCGDFRLMGAHSYDHIVFDNGIEHYEYPDVWEEDTLYLNTMNMFMRQEDLPAIYSAMNHLQFNQVKVERCQFPQNIECGEIIAFTDGVNSYPTIAQFLWTYNNGWTGGFSFMVDSVTQEESRVEGANDKIKILQVSVNHNTQLLDIYGANIDELNNNSIHFYVDGNLGQCVVSADGIDDSTNPVTYPGAYMSMKRDGMRIFVDGSQVAQGTAGRFDCDQGLGVQEWNIQSLNNGNSLCFFRKG